MGSNGRPGPWPSSSRSLVEDDRAIEGLPIRLVIALIVGVVSLGIMLQILGGVGTFEDDTEVDVEFGDDVFDAGTDSTVTVAVVDEDGNEVPDATVIATAGSAQMDGAVVESTPADDNEVTLDLSSENLRLPPDQDTGTVEFEVQPPSGTNWVDEQPNDELLVVE